jgi:hypothetical protein
MTPKGDMKRKLHVAILLALLFLMSSARAGWYEIRNFVGTVGSAPVHVSLQTFDSVNKGDSAQWHVDGSYYYDVHRIPIPLQGQRQADGSMVLCEAEQPRSIVESPQVPVASAKIPVPCPIALKFSDDKVGGEWNDGKKVLPIVLRQVGNLNDDDSIQLNGIVEVPMWYHTKTHLLLGIYESSEDCPVSMRHLRLINTATGQVDRELAFDCDAGMVMTTIYSNVSRGPTIHKVTVGFRGGKMGHDEVIDITPWKAKQK